MSKNKCSWCKSIRKASGLNYLVCPDCKKKRRQDRQERKHNSEELDKLSRKLNKQSIRKFKRERGN